MSLILHIDTATETANVSIAKSGTVVAEAFNYDQKDHAAFLQPAIKEIAEKAGIALTGIDAVAVASGPGSYTGLRVGMASAKGLCYALNKPLICVGTLDILAKSVLLQSSVMVTADTLICSMIDARRMEVFAAVYTQNMDFLLPPQAIILTENSFITFLEKNRIIFGGSGINKWQKLVKSENASFLQIQSNSEAISEISLEKMAKSEFSDIAYTEPQYLKEFFNNQLL